MVNISHFTEYSYLWRILEKNEGLNCQYNMATVIFLWQLCLGYTPDSSGWSSAHIWYITHNWKWGNSGTNTAILEVLGVDVQRDGVTQTVTAAKDNVEINLVNGGEKWSGIVNFVSKAKACLPFRCRPIWNGKKSWRQGLMTPAWATNLLEDALSWSLKSDVK